MYVIPVIMEQLTDIQTFYKNQTIFITGGTGFIGKVLIEKLLRVCYNLTAIYILVRPKWNKTADERFEEIFEYPCFDLLKQSFPNFKQKIHLINGNCEEPNLGISHHDREILIKNVSIVFHAAANVKLDQPLRSAVKNSVQVASDILDLVHEMSELKAFIYVSTAYSNYPQINIKEQFYEPGMKAKNLLTLLKVVDDETLKVITPQLIGKWPNSYTFAKCVAEDLLKTKAKELLVSIVRPAIIISTADEPVPGWIDNFYGLVGVTVGMMMVGAIKSFYCKRQAVVHCVPCDYVVNNIIAAAWDLSKRTSSLRSNNIPIYNYVGSNKIFLTMKQLEDDANKFLWQYPPYKSMIWYPVINFNENILWHKIRIFFLHTVLSYIVDFVLICFRQKPIAVKKYKQINKLLNLTSYFTTKTLNFDYVNVEKLWEQMSEKDKQLFKFNMDGFVWEKYWLKGLENVRMFLLKESPDSIPKARIKMFLFGIVHYTLIFLSLYFSLIFINLLFF